MPENLSNFWDISTIAETIHEIGEAKALFLTGQHSQAEYLLETGAQKHPAHCDCWHALGHARRVQGNMPAAVDAYSKAIEVAYRYHSVIHFECSAQHLRRALLYFEMGEDAKAQADITKAIFQDHNNQPALKLRAEGWQRGMELPEYDSNIMTELGCEQEIQRKGLQVEQLLPFQQTHDKAIYYWRHGNTEMAIGLLSDILEQRGDYSMAWHHRALMFLQLGDQRQALADLEKACAAGVKWHQNYHYGAALHHYHRGQIYRETGQPDMAQIDLQKAAEIDSRFAKAHAEMAMLHAEAGQFPTAIAAMEKALSIDSAPHWQQQRQEWVDKLANM